MPENNYIITETEKGNICIAEDVLGLIVQASLKELDGVAGLANPNAIGSDIAGFFGIKNTPKGIKACCEDGKTVFDLIIMVRYGYPVSATARKVQDSVSAAVEAMTGMDTVVNVHVNGISFEKAELK